MYIYDKIIVIHSQIYSYMFNTIEKAYTIIWDVNLKSTIIFINLILSVYRIHDKDKNDITILYFKSLL